MLTTGNVTIKDIAEVLHVSAKTVSSSLNGTGRISAATREKIRQVAQEMGYVRNAAASALRTQVKDTVGLLITLDIVNPWYSQLVSLVESELSKRGLSMLLILGKSDPEKAGRAMRNFIGSQVRGILAGPIFRREDVRFIQMALDHRVPVIAFNSLEDMQLNLVNIDQSAGAIEAVNYLASLGHRRIMYLGGPLNPGDHITGTRLSGYTQAMSQLGLPCDILPTPHGVSRKSGYGLAQQLLAERQADQLPTAIFCHNDDMALGTMLALQQVGMRIPQDISIIGFDDIDESSYSFPALTTMGGVMHELAEALVNSLLAPPCNEGLFLNQLIKPKLIVRDSTAALNHRS